MTQFTEVNIDLTTTTLEEGFSFFKKGPIHSIGYGYKTRGEIIPGKHWSATWVNTQGMGNHGQAYIKPVSKEARRMVREHTISQWMEAGLSKAQASGLYRMNIRYKHELIHRLVPALKDDGVVRAFSCFPGVGPQAHLPWYNAWESVVSDILEGLSWWRRAALIEMVTELSEQEVS